MNHPEIPSSTKASSRLARLDAYWCAVAVICLGSFVLRLWFGLHFSWFSDDWTYMVRMNSLPLTQFFLESYNGHIGPGQFLLVWLLDSVAPLSFTAATLVASVIGVIGVAVWGAALRRIFGPRRALLVPVAAIALSPTLIWSNMWWASAVQAGPLQVCLGGMVYFSARWAQRPSRRGLLALVLVFTAGLLFWEKALLGVFPAIGVMWMLLSGNSRKRLGTILPAVATLAVVSLGYLVVYVAILRIYPGTWYAIIRADPDLSAGGLVRIGVGVVLAVRDTLTPALVGGPWGSVTFNLDTVLAERTVITTICGSVVLALLVVGGVLRRHGWVPVLMLAGYVGVAASLTVGSTMGVVLGVDAMRNPRLFADSLPVTWLAILLLLMPTVTERDAGVAAWRRGLLPTRAMHVAVTLFAATAAVGTVAGCVALWGPIQARQEPREWANNLRADVEMERSTVLLGDARPPTEVYEFGFWPEEAWLSKMLANMPGVRFEGSADAMYVVQSDGHLQRSAVLPDAEIKPGPVADCGYAVGAEQTKRLPLTTTLIGWNWGMEASFVAGQPGDLTLTVDGVDIPIAVPQGVSTQYAPINSPVSKVSIRGSASSGVVCLVDMKFGALAPDSSS